MHPQVQEEAPIFFHPSHPLTTDQYASASSLFNSEVPHSKLMMNPTHSTAPTANNSSSSSTSHSLAEKRRRQRINSHLSALKRLVPHSDKKMDKGSLLGCVVDHLKDLKRSLVEEIIQQESTIIPNESDEIIVDHLTASTTAIGTTTTNNDTGNSDCGNRGKYNEIYLKATVSCEDRPELFMDLIEALKGLKMLRTIRTDIVTLGGRITLNIVLINIGNYESSGNINCLNSLKQSLRAVLGRVVTSSSSSSHWTSTSGFSSKRQRLLFPQHHSHFPW